MYIILLFFYIFLICFNLYYLNSYKLVYIIFKYRELNINFNYRNQTNYLIFNYLIIFEIKLFNYKQYIKTWKKKQKVNKTCIARVPFF